MTEEKVVEGKVGDQINLFGKTLPKDIGNLREELYKVFTTKEDFAKLEVKLSKTKVDLKKWFFVFLQYWLC